MTLGATETPLQARRNRSVAPIFYLPYSESLCYERLMGFVQYRIRISHVYQPVMMLTLLRG